MQVLLLIQITLIYFEEKFCEIDMDNTMLIITSIQAELLKSSHPYCLILKRL